MKVFDAHSDILTDVTSRRLRGETDVIYNRHYERLKKGGVGGMIMVIWIDPPHDRDPVTRTGQIFQAMTDEFRETKAVRPVKSYDEMMKAREAGEIYAWIGLEGMAYIQDDISRLDDYYEHGARIGMLTWNESNSLASGASSGETTGLTPLGREVVKRMQDKGMLVDVSHLNDAGFWDITKLAVSPIIASHSNCRSICGAPRNLTDDQLRAIRDLGGVVGINSYRNFVDDDLNKATAERLAEHADHMIDVMGIEHVGLGFDFFEFVGDDSDPDAFSGSDSGCIGLEDCTGIGYFLDLLRKRGISEEELEMIAFKNYHRVLRECIG